MQNNLTRQEYQEAAKWWRPEVPCRDDNSLTDSLTDSNSLFGRRPDAEEIQERGRIPVLQ